MPDTLESVQADQLRFRKALEAGLIAQCAAWGIKRSDLGRLLGNPPGYSGVARGQTISDNMKLMYALHLLGIAQANPAELPKRWREYGGTEGRATERPFDRSEYNSWLQSEEAGKIRRLKTALDRHEDLREELVVQISTRPPHVSKVGTLNAGRSSDQSQTGVNRQALDNYMTTEIHPLIREVASLHASADALLQTARGIAPRINLELLEAMVEQRRREDDDDAVVLLPKFLNALSRYQPGGDREQELEAFIIDNWHHLRLLMTILAQWGNSPFAPRGNGK
jgi:hypothetical protein